MSCTAPCKCGGEYEGEDKGPLFAIDGPYVSHGQSTLLTDRYFRLTDRTFRMGRHSAVMPGVREMGIVGAELREIAKDVANVQKLECLALRLANAVGNMRERIKDHYLRLTVRTFRTDSQPCLRTVIFG